jgi:hypothetical protein
MAMSSLGMLHTNATKEHGNGTRAKVSKEMAKPPMARSARITELSLDTARTPKQPDGLDHRYRELRIENTLTDEHGDDVKLKKGAHVKGV